MRASLSLQESRPLILHSNNHHRLLTILFAQLPQRLSLSLLLPQMEKRRIRLSISNWSVWWPPRPISPLSRFKELERIVPKLRAAWPTVQIIIRADSGFCRDKILSWCEANHADSIIGLAKNKCLTKAIGGEFQQALQQFQRIAHAACVFKDFRCRTKKSWSCERRVVAKAEHLSKGANPRFFVTSLSKDLVDARTLYEDRYCARGDMENRIKEQQLYLFADRTSTHGMRSIQLRLLFSTMAYLLHVRLREFGLAGIEMENAQSGTIRAKLLRIGGRISVSVRRICIALSESYSYHCPFERILQNIRRHSPTPQQISHLRHTMIPQQMVAPSDASAERCAQSRKTAKHSAITAAATPRTGLRHTKPLATRQKLPRCEICRLATFQEFTEGRLRDRIAGFRHPN